MSQFIRLLQSLFLVCVVLVPAARSQSSFNSLAEDGFDTRTFDLILKVRDRQYDQSTIRDDVAALREAFSRSSDQATKENLANAVLILGEKDEVYWRLLSKRSQQILEMRPPSPLVYDTNGKSVKNVISPAFMKWAETQELPLDKALEQCSGTLPVEFTLMATVGDARGLPLLQRGLESTMYGAQAAAAEGLAILQHTGSIPLIIETTKRAPAELQWFIGRSLVAFDEPLARSASKSFAPSQELLESDQKAVKARGPRGLQ